MERTSLFSLLLGLAAVLKLPDPPASSRGILRCGHPANWAQD